jgi:hypothetical protein
MSRAGKEVRTLAKRAWERFTVSTVRPLVATVLVIRNISVSKEGWGQG